MSNLSKQVIVNTLMNIHKYPRQLRQSYWLIGGHMTMFKTSWLKR